MSIIKIENLTFSYPGSYDNIFENASLQIDTDWKLGFVGRNGRGKTTLLKLLLGSYEYSGRIISSVQFDYFPYPVADKSLPALQILQSVCPLAEEWEIMREFSYLAVDCEALFRPFDTLSNGEQTKILLAALFLNEGHFLLIDEPTNHLDIEARTLTADYLKRKKGFILVSHDRSFLDGCVDHILSLNKATIDVQSGNFSSWMMNFKRQQDLELAQNEHLKQDIRRLQNSSKRSAAWSCRTEASKYASKSGTKPPDRGYIGHKSAKMMKRAKALQARQQQAIEQKSALLQNAETADALKLSPLTYRTSTLLSLSEVAACYEGNAVCTPVSFSVQQGERIAIDGKNGSGKSSLLKLLAGEQIEHKGILQSGSGLVISYVPQDTSHLRGRLSDFAMESHIDESLFKAILHKMGFSRTQLEKEIQSLSSGQKKKTLLAKSLCEQAHLYIWDEPLNFIDIYSRMQIEQLICNFSPTMVFVEHDKAFRDHIATKTVRL